MGSEMVAEMHHRGMKLDVVAYTAFIECHRLTDDFNKVAQVVAEMKQYSIEPDAFTYKAIARAAISAGDFRALEQLKAEVQDRGLKRTVDIDSLVNFADTCVGDFSKEQK